MNTITITLSQSQFDKLRELSFRFGIPPEDLARAGMEDMLARPDESFRKTLSALLSKNDELYQQLAKL